ncbi:TPA: C40 family peptidase [Clostridioides difficile]|nr:C40 family peptidase [Clostridioides difficile]
MLNSIKKKIILSVISLSIAFIMIFMLILSLFFIANNSSGGGYYSGGILEGVPEEYMPYFNEAATIFHVPNWTLAAIAKQESNFNPEDAYGGAWGIMQIQKTDWSYYISNGLGDLYKSVGYSFSSADNMWQKYLNDVRAQVLAGSWECMRYTNIVLKSKNIIDSVPYKDNQKMAENMDLINWNASENDATFKEILRRSFACYNGGPGYGLKVNLDKAQNNYPNKVFKYAMEFRESASNLPDISGNPNSPKAKQLLDIAFKQKGKPYVWGATGPNSFDCSGFTQYCHKQIGIQIPRTAQSQSYAGKPVDKNNLQAGDLVFFGSGVNDITHVGMYIGNRQFIHSPQTGDVVKITSLDKEYYARRFKIAKRFI